MKKEFYYSIINQKSFLTQLLIEKLKLQSLAVLFSINNIVQVSFLKYWSIILANHYFINFNVLKFLLANAAKSQVV